ncbi:MAG: methionine--tRNA ligase subunit beta [Candidatus Paceibacterota bacterium]|jgi:methionyl-tRNA synthetase
MDLKPQISYDDFTKLDLRIGRIESAELVPDSKKLLKLLVDFGDFKRQIISGIAKGYAPEALVGKQVTFIINLEPRMLAGLESQGMILAADVADVPVLLIPDKEVANGAGIH